MRDGREGRKGRGDTKGWGGMGWNGARRAEWDGIERGGGG